MSLIRAATKMAEKVGGKISGKMATTGSEIGAKGSGKMGGVGVGAMVNGGMGVYFGYDGYNSAREQGNGVVSSLASAVGEAALPMLMGGWAYAGYLAATELPGAAVSAVESYNQYGRSLAKQNRQTPFMNAKFNETQQTFTMRQAGMALAQKSKYNLQQTMLGNEAQYMHR